ncbi:chitinase [Cladophialophora carrionii]|uniref:chitinase n=1 Tax=Cladophialophora carrionii TaxID=86049 RepID=A0A1C1CM23_9EURO|nr:chitinase [Cladophialophora carrionii]
MAVMFRLLTLFSLTVFIGSVFASAPSQDWQHVAATLRGTLDVLQLSHEQYLAQVTNRHSRRDSTFRTGPAGYWQPLAANKRLDASDDFSGQLHDLINEIGSAVQQLIELLASQFDNIGGLLISTSTSSTPAAAPTTAQPSILPITDLNTPPAATTTSRSLVPDRPLYTSTSSSPSATYTFNPRAADLNVVYYSQTDLTPVISLSEVCDDPAIDMVILAFVTHLVSDGGYPAMNMASNCWAPNAAQQAAGAAGLLDCVGDGFAGKIARCQKQGKKVMLSLGGSVGDLSMSSDAQAEKVANTLWDLFLGGTDPTSAPLRPYGDVVLDGIDIDNESPSGSPYLPTLARTLRQLMSTAPKPYYLSAAPQCPRPDASVPVPALLPYTDFLAVQFYNNPSCQLGRSPTVANEGFFSSLQDWSNDLLALGSPVSGSRVMTRASPRSLGFQNINNGIDSPRLLIGTPAFAGAGSGYVDVPTYKTMMQRVRGLGLPNLAGAMFWDGAYQEVSATEVGNDGINATFAEVVKQVFA